MDSTVLRILVGVDGSPGARAALVWAFGEAVSRGARLEVFSAFPVDFSWTDPYLLDARRVDTLQADTEARAHALVDEVRADPVVAGAASAALSVEVRVAAGPAAEHLVGRSEGAGLLVVGSRGRGALRSTLVGSVALHCAAHARCPVVVVHTPSTQAGDVVVGVDRSEASAEALRAAAAAAARSGARLRVVAAYQGTNYWSDLYAVMAPPAGQSREQALRATERIVAAELDGLGEGAAPAADVVVEEGSPADVLVRQARDARLLVVGSRGRSRLAGLVLGSVALSCVLHASCPVMVVHPRRHANPQTAPDAAASVPVPG